MTEKNYKITYLRSFAYRKDSCSGHVGGFTVYRKQAASFTQPFFGLFYARGQP